MNIPVQEVQVNGFRKNTLILSAFYIAMLLSGCATTSPQNASTAANDDPDATYPSSAEEGKSGSRVVFMSPTGEIIVQGVKLKNTQFDYPVTINAGVEKWVDYFTGRGRKHFEKYLERSELFIPYIRPILKQHGLPEDLVYLAMIESGFNNHARSFAKAVGPWQFISATGKRYGLAVNWWIDERRDTRKSTISAAEYLKDLYGMFHSWELAAAAYNAGEAKIAKAIRRYGTADFWSIARQKYLRPETRNYVPKIIAAALIAKNRTQFGFKPESAPAGLGEAVAPDGTVVKLESESAQSSLAASREALDSVIKGEDYETSASADVAEEEPVNPVAESKTPSIDEDSEDVEAVTGGAAPAEKDNQVALARPIATPHVNKKGELSGEELLEFEVQSPADLLKIARAAGLSYHTVKSLNPELLRWCTPPNSGTYRVKLPASSKDRFLTNYNHPSFEKRVRFAAFKIKRGQTLESVARHFGIRIEPLMDLNGISARSMLRAGTIVRVPMPNDNSRSVAALEIRDPPERRRGKKFRKRSSRKVIQQVTMHRPVTKLKRLKSRRSSSY